MKSLPMIVIAALLLGAAFFPKLRPHASAVSNDNATTLLELEARFMKAAAERGSQGYMSYYAEDAVELPNSAPILQGKVNIAKTMGFLDNRENHLIWTPIAADVSASGDLGYTYGNYEFRSKSKDGRTVVEHGKYTTIWKKQKDGTWKVILDMGNKSLEATP